MEGCADVEKRGVFHPDASRLREGAHVHDLGHEGAVEAFDAAFDRRLPKTRQEEVKRLEWPVGWRNVLQL